LVALVVAGCQDGYPIAATRCDRWCDVRRATECGNYNPAACVVACEQASSGSDCDAEFDILLACLESTPQSQITCETYRLGTAAPCYSKQTALYACSNHFSPGSSGAE